MIPVLDLHGPSLVELLMHLERLPQQMRFVAPTLLQAFVFSSFEII